MKDFKVLLIDDEAELVFTLAERLVIRGIDAAAVTNGEAALKILEQKEFDVVLADVKMPGLGGIDLTKKIKKEHPHTQIILMTGRGSEEESTQGLREGAFDYLLKPVDINILIDKMQKAADA
ncbi:MAG: response regulator [Candidatus Omnitrophota bacterium]|jgi:DNA-binding response OmpR family regulator|nr:MAG: response regulator [Candidatus Omnitrophota bacterium]